MKQRFWPLGLLAFVVLGGCLRGNAATSAPWFQRSLVGLEVGPTWSQFGGVTNDPGFAIRFDGHKRAVLS